jgi:hypothetical protein
MFGCTRCSETSGEKPASRTMYVTDTTKLGRHSRDVRYELNAL